MCEGVERVKIGVDREKWGGCEILHLQVKQTL